MTNTQSKVQQIALPATSRLNHIYETTKFAEAYPIGLPCDATSDPETLARLVFAELPTRAKNLMKARDAVVSALGLKTSRQLTAAGPAVAAASTRRVGIFRIYETLPTEILIGEADKHLDFQLWVPYQPATAAAGSAPRVVVSTVVHCHNLLGRSHLRLIEPFHCQIIKACLRRAARAGWPIARTQDSDGGLQQQR